MGVRAQERTTDKMLKKTLFTGCASASTTPLPLLPPLPPLPLLPLLPLATRTQFSPTRDRLAEAEMNQKIRS